MTRQFFESSGRHGDFFEITKKQFLHKVYGSMCIEFQVCIVFRLAKRRDKYTHIQVKLGISSTGCSPHLDFENRKYTNILANIRMFPKGCAPDVNLIVFRYGLPGQCVYQIPGRSFFGWLVGKGGGDTI